MQNSGETSRENAEVRSSAVTASEPTQSSASRETLDQFGAARGEKTNDASYHYAGTAGIQYAAAARRNKSSLNAGSFDSVIASGFERTGQGFPPLPSSQAVGALGLPVGNLSMPLAVLVERRRS